MTVHPPPAGLVLQALASIGYSGEVTRFYGFMREALEARGVGPRPAVYVGSWSDWISDPARPVAAD